MIQVHHPASWLPERGYVLRTLLDGWVGEELDLVAEQRADTCIERLGGAGHVVIADGLFAGPEPDAAGAEPASAPPPLAWRVGEPDLRRTVTADVLPLLHPTDGDRPVHVVDREVTMRFDLLGTAFTLLTARDEAVDPSTDRHGRFPLESSLAWQAGVHERPLVDEYRSLLLWALRRAGVADPPPRRPGTLRLTHDVDRPVAANEGGVGALVRRTGADVLLRRDPALAGSRLATYPRARRGDVIRDPSYAFEFLMDVAEGAGRTATFNLLARGRDEEGAVPPSRYDASYRLTDPFMDALIRRIVERGHAIGLHGSYNTIDSGEQLALEVEALRAAMERAGHDLPAVSGRQHYLRWRPETWCHLAAAGVSADSSVGFAEGPGFRSGTCHPFPVFDLTTRSTLPLTEHPLLIMDATLDPVALRRGAFEQIASRIGATVDACRTMRGELVILWHNTSVVGRRARGLYRELVEHVGGTARA
ncbi:MAG TPA: polysaccharide deacetylase family protein [Actinomycetota bacterium]